MGCDIHLWIEKLENSIWHFAHEYKIEDEDCETWIDWTEPYGSRNYHLFSILAGIRNNRGIFTPIALPRGIPGDISEIGKKICDQWKNDAHSHSWLMAAELLEYDWQSPVTFDGFLKLDDFQQLNTQSKCPLEWVVESTWPYLWRAQWEQPQAVYAGTFYSEFLPKLPDYGIPSHVRMVFFFDN